MQTLSGVVSTAPNPLDPAPRSPLSGETADISTDAVTTTTTATSTTSSVLAMLPVTCSPANGLVVNNSNSSNDDNAAAVTRGSSSSNSSNSFTTDVGVDDFNGDGNDAGSSTRSDDGNSGCDRVSAVLDGAQDHGHSPYHHQHRHSHPYLSSNYHHHHHHHPNHHSSLHVVNAGLWLLLAVLMQLASTRGAVASLLSMACSSVCSHGTCSYPVAHGNKAIVACHCHPGWGGEQCSIPCSRSCGHGQCVFVGDRQVCLCRLGFVGQDCSQPGYDVVTLLSLARLINAGPPSFLHAAAVLAGTSASSKQQQKKNQQEVEIVSLPSAVGLLAATKELAFAAGRARTLPPLPPADVKPKQGDTTVVVKREGEGAIETETPPSSSSSASSVVASSDLGLAKAGVESPVDPPSPPTPPPLLQATERKPKPPAAAETAATAAAAGNPDSQSSVSAAGSAVPRTGSGSGSKAWEANQARLVVSLVENPREHVERNVERGSSQCMMNFVCRNGGRCVTGTFGGFRCLCAPPFFGTFCESSCPTTCYNGGRCMKLRQRPEEAGRRGGAWDLSVPTSSTMGLSASGYRFVYRCVCPSLYAGEHCQRKINNNG